MCCKLEESFGCSASGPPSIPSNPAQPPKPTSLKLQSSPVLVQQGALALASRNELLHSLRRSPIKSCLQGLAKLDGRNLMGCYALSQTLSSCSQVRSFGKQLLESVAYLHDLTLIHTDLKPENILLESLQYDKMASSGSSRYSLCSGPMHGTSKSLHTFHKRKPSSGILKDHLQHVMLSAEGRGCDPGRACLSRLCYRI